MHVAMSGLDKFLLKLNSIIAGRAEAFFILSKK
jgi:hypothetical protein